MSKFIARPTVGLRTRTGRGRGPGIPIHTPCVRRPRDAASELAGVCLAERALGRVTSSEFGHTPPPPPRPTILVHKRSIHTLAMRWLMAFLVLGPVLALYEAPPGGCSIPPGYDDPISSRLPPPRPKPKPPPPPQEPQLTEVEEQEKLERELYERESMVQLSGLGEDEEDWDAVERQQQRELAFRELLKKVALVLVIAYAAHSTIRHLQRLGGGTGVKPPAADAGGAQTPKSNRDGSASSPAAPSTSADATVKAAAAGMKDDAEDKKQLGGEDDKEKDAGPGESEHENEVDQGKEEGHDAPAKDDEKKKGD